MRCLSMVIGPGGEVPPDEGMSISHDELRGPHGGASFRRWAQDLVQPLPHVLVPDTRSMPSRSNSSAVAHRARVTSAAS